MVSATQLLLVLAKYLVAELFVQDDNFVTKFLYAEKKDIVRYLSIKLAFESHQVLQTCISDSCTSSKLASVARHWFSN